MKKIPNKLAKNMLATVAYYDCLDYPLTVFELWKYMIRTDYYAAEKQSAFSYNLADVVRELKNNTLGAYIEHRSGFYFLKGGNALVEKRIAGGKISAQKMKRLRSVVKILRCVPFVRMIGVTGRLAMKNARAKSDWDVLVVCQRGRIWTGRTLVTLITHLLGKRRHGKHVCDRVCLNYFITDESLEVITKDLFSANEYSFLFPLYGSETFNRFQIKNQWIRTMKPAYTLSEIPPLPTLADSRISTMVRSLGEKLLAFDFIEKFLKKIEKKKIMENPKTAQEGSLIHAHDGALVFLPEPHGPLVFERFKKKIEENTI